MFYGFEILMIDMFKTCRLYPIKHLKEDVK